MEDSLCCRMAQPPPRGLLLKCSFTVLGKGSGAQDPRALLGTLDDLRKRSAFPHARAEAGARFPSLRVSGKVHE